MAKWVFEPGHTAAEFRSRHMMVTWVRGSFRDIHGSLDFDPDNPRTASVEVTIDASTLVSGEVDRDAHLRSPDFLDVENHPTITFRGDQVEVAGANDYVVTGDLTIRGVTREVELEVRQIGQWDTPWWVGDVDEGPKLRAGFVATTEINRHDFGVSWNSAMDKGGVVVGDTVYITIDAEALLEG